MKQRSYYVSLLSNWNNRVLYVGVTNDLTRRVYEHKQKLAGGFTTKYNVNKLAYFEQTIDVLTALTREKEIKKWREREKERLSAEHESRVAGPFGREERFLAALEMTDLLLSSFQSRSLIAFPQLSIAE